MFPAAMSGNKAKFSYHEPKLSGARRSSSSRRRASNLDFDLSRFRHSKDQSESLSTIACLSIAPQPAANLKNKAEKRVAFNLDHFPSLTKVISSTMNSEYSKKLLSADVFADAIKFSLEHKDNFCQEFNSFLEYAEFTASESSIPFQQCLDDARSLTELDDHNATVYLEGNLEVIGPSENQIQLVKSSKIMPSKKATIEENSAEIDAEDIWPWSWLDPEKRSKGTYKSLARNRVTFCNQESLPRIPLPVLAKTLQWCLESVKPCVSDKVFATTLVAVNNFAKSDGKMYHELLINDSANKRDSWIKNFLPNYSHCYSRQEGPMLNTAIVAPFMYDLWPEKSGTQVNRAAILVELAIEFWQLIRDERLLPVMMDGHPTCMHEYRKLYSSVKLPGIPRDEIFYCFTTNPDLETPRHIIVFYKGRIFSIEVLNANYVRQGTEHIKNRLLNIIKSVDEGVCLDVPNVGILTSLDRNKWSDYRIRLMNLSPENQGSLNEIERSMFVLSLDHMTGNDVDRLPHNAIFGNGFNRWYDKNLNFCISKTGLITISANVSIIEGSTVAMLLNYIHLRIMEDAEKWDDDVIMSVSVSTMDVSRTSLRMDELLTKIASQASIISDMTYVTNRIEAIKKESASETALHEDSRHLIFVLDEELESAVKDAKINFSELALSLKTAVCHFDSYERDLFSWKEIKKDAFANLVLQLTFFRMYYRHASVGTRVSLRRFHYGRYEILRATTSEAVNWCKIMLDPDSKFEAKVSNFVIAERKHIALLNNVFSGNGCENHLAALRVIAEDVFEETPDLFNDEGYIAAGGCGNFDIYTESLGGESTGCPVVWPTCPEGYGVGYFIASTKIVFNVTSWEEEVGTSADLFARSLSHTLHGMHAILKHLRHQS